MALQLQDNVLGKGFFIPTNIIFFIIVVVFRALTGKGASNIFSYIKKSLITFRSINSYNYTDQFSFAIYKTRVICDLEAHITGFTFSCLVGNNRRTH